MRRRCQQPCTDRRILEYGQASTGVIDELHSGYRVVGRLGHVRVEPALHPNCKALQARGDHHEFAVFDDVCIHGRMLLSLHLGQIVAGGADGHAETVRSAGRVSRHLGGNHADTAVGTGRNFCLIRVRPL